MERVGDLIVVRAEGDPGLPRRYPEAVMEILRDHEGAPEAICVHPDPNEGSEASAVMFSMVAELEEGRMWVAPGNPCKNEYREIDLAGVW